MPSARSLDESDGCFQMRAVPAYGVRRLRLINFFPMRFHVHDSLIPFRPTLLIRLVGFCPFESTFGIELELLTGCSKLESLSKFVIVPDLIGFARSPSCGNVLNGLGHKHHFLSIRRKGVLDVLVDESLHMKLPKNMLLPVAVIAEQPEILVCLSPLGFFSCGG